MTTSEAVLIPASQRSVVSRFNPFNAERRRLLREVTKILSRDHAEKLASRQRELEAMDPTERAVHESMDELASITYSAGPAATQVKASLFRFSDVTLRYIAEEFGGDNFKGSSYYLLKHMHSSDISLREAVLFRNELEGASQWFRMLDDLRLSHPDFMREDLTELDEETRVRARAVLFISNKVFNTVVEKYSDAPIPTMLAVGGPVTNYSNRKSEPVFRMAPDLMEVVFGNLDRVEDIVGYLAERLNNDVPVHAAHLSDYLSLPTKSLGSGVL